MPSTGNIVFTVLSVAIVVCLWLRCKDRGLPGFRRYKIMDVIYMIREYFPPCGLRPTARISGPCPVRVALVASVSHSLPLCRTRCRCVALTPTLSATVRAASVLPQGSRDVRGYIFGCLSRAGVPGWLPGRPHGRIRLQLPYTWSSGRRFRSLRFRNSLGVMPVTLLNWALRCAVLE